MDVLLFLLLFWVIIDFLMLGLNKQFRQQMAEKEEKSISAVTHSFPNLKEIIQCKQESTIPLLDELKSHVDLSHTRSNVYIPMDSEDSNFEELCAQIAKEFHCTWGKFSEMNGGFPYETGFFINAMDDDIRRFFFNEN